MKHEAMLGKMSGSAPANPLRVLMVYWDGGGNLPPQRALARELKRRGHEVHVLTHDTQAKSVASDGATFHSLATARQWDPTRHNTADEERAFISEDLAGSSGFAGDFLATHAALGPDICVIDVMLISTQKLALERGITFAVFNHLAWITEGGCIGLSELLGRRRTRNRGGFDAFRPSRSRPARASSELSGLRDADLQISPHSFRRTDPGAGRICTVASPISGTALCAGQSQQHLPGPGINAAEHMHRLGATAARGTGHDRQGLYAQLAAGCGHAGGAVICAARRGTSVG